MRIRPPRVSAAAILLSAFLMAWAGALPPASAASPAAQPAFTVAVLGDYFGEALADGLRMSFAGQPDISILNRTHPPYGLSSEANYEWPIAARNMFASAGHIDAAVIMLGFDDTRTLHDGATPVPPGTPRWKELYGDRVNALATLFQEKRVPLIWVGLPVAADEALSAKFVALNEIIRDRAGRAGATYVDSWDAFADENGKFSATGPDLNGQIVRLRTGDGLDFTRAGVRKLASFVEPEIRKDREKRNAPPADPAAMVVQSAPDFDKALDIDINNQIRREAGLPALPAARSGRDGAGPVGPVVTITAPALAANGRLAEETSPALAEIGGSLAQRALVQGQPIQPKPGRIDDFAWPRP